MHPLRTIVRAVGHAELGIQIFKERMQMANELENTAAYSFLALEHVLEAARWPLD